MSQSLNPGGLGMESVAPSTTQRAWARTSSVATLTPGSVVVPMKIVGLKFVTRELVSMNDFAAGRRLSDDDFS